MEPLDATDPESIGPYRLVTRLGAGGMGRVYLARSAGGRTADGRQQWRIKAYRGRFSPVVASGGVLYTGDGRDGISAFEAATGKRLWTCELPKRPSLTSAPVLVGGTLFVPGGYGMGLHAVDVRSGILKWTFQDESNPGSYDDWYLSADGNLAFAWLGTITYGLPT